MHVADHSVVLDWLISHRASLLRKQWHTFERPMSRAVALVTGPVDRAGQTEFADRDVDLGDLLSLGGSICRTGPTQRQCRLANGLIEFGHGNAFSIKQPRLRWVFCVTRGVSE